MQLDDNSEICSSRKEGSEQFLIEVESVDVGPDLGPHPISQEQLRAAFSPSTGWRIAAIEPDRIQTRFHDDGAPAWFATIKRI